MIRTSARQEARPGVWARHVVLAFALAALGATVFAWPRIPQDPSYHLMADQRSCLGIPNCVNVASNLPFAVVGALGLVVTFARRGRPAFLDPWERWPYAALFAGTALTALGSAYYHLDPDNERLVWDRLPMTLGFMGLLTAVIAERVSVRLSRRIFVPLLIAGAASVLYWFWSELQGAGDLRPYVLVQFGSLVGVVLLLVLYRSSYSGTGYVFAGLAAYAIAKASELADHAVFTWSHVVSGHTLKHLLAALAVACLVAMLRVREPHPPERTAPS